MSSPHSASAADGTVASTDAPAAAGPSSSRRVVIAATAGTMLELYDFALYGLAAALVFGPVFFPDQNGLNSTLLAFATFGLGFAARPLGGIVFGHYADRVGRKTVLVTTLLLMGVCTAALGLLPGAATIGVWAPILLTALRLLQGFSQGGENGAAAVMVAESAPVARRGVLMSLPAAFAGLGTLLAIGVFSLFSALTGDDFLTWGWRIPFVLGLLPALVGLWIRLKLPESSTFESVKEQGGHRPMPIAVLVRSARRDLLIGIAVIAGFNAFLYALTVFSLTYITTILQLPRSVSLTATLLGTVALVLATPCYAALSDRVGRRPVMMGGAAFIAVYAFVLFALLNTRVPWVVVVAVVVGILGAAALFAPSLTLLSELFDTSIRVSGVSTSYQLGAMLGGGISPFIATALFAWSGSWVWISLYLGLWALASLAALALVRETRSRSLDEEAPLNLAAS